MPSDHIRLKPVRVAILRVIAAHWKRTGEAPLERDIRAAVAKLVPGGSISERNIRYHVAALRTGGYLAHHKRAQRGWPILTAAGREALARRSRGGRGDV